jgi:hypothetical protein
MTPPLVMPTIEPDWDASLAGAVAYTDARAPFCRSFLASFSHRSTSAILARRHGLDADALTFPHAPM